MRPCCTAGTTRPAVEIASLPGRPYRPPLHPTVDPFVGAAISRPQTVEKPRRRLLEQSSGECVQGVKTPCAFNQYGFSNFFKSLKIRPAWRKDFFDTLGAAISRPCRAAGIIRTAARLRNTGPGRPRAGGRGRMRRGAGPRGSLAVRYGPGRRRRSRRRTCRRTGGG